MRAWLLVVLLPLAAACSTATPSGRPALPRGTADISGRWTGVWTGTGIYNSPREDTAQIELIQVGKRGVGRVRLDGTVAAESMPEEVRMQGLAGIRVIARVSGSRVTLRHELGGYLFTADLDVKGDRMVGYVRGASPSGRLVLARERTVVSDAPPASSAPKPLAAPAPISPAPDAVKEAERPKDSVGTPAPESTPAEPSKAIAAIEPQPAAPEEAGPKPDAEQLANASELSAIHFDFNVAALREDALEALATHAMWLRDHPDAKVLIEGHCDDKGSDAYNVKLGDRRANAVKEYLTAAGVDTERIKTVSYGKHRRLCHDLSDECRDRNRRAEFRIKLR